RQRGAELSLGAGDALFVGLDAGRFTVVRPERSGLIDIRVPRGTSALDCRDAGPPRLVPRHVAPLQLGPTASSCSTAASTWPVGGFATPGSPRGPSAPSPATSASVTCPTS